MQNRKHDINVAEHVRYMARSASYDLHIALICPRHHVSVRLGDRLDAGQFTAGDGELGWIVADLEPGAVTGNADSDDLISVPVDGIVTGNADSDDLISVPVDGP